MNKSIYFNKLIHRCPDSIGDTKPFIYVQSKWDGDNAHFILQDSKSNKCFKGILKNSEIAESAQELDIEYELFYDECRAALTANLALPNFQYEIKDDALKVCKMEDFEIEYLNVNLQETENRCEMLETALSLIEEQRENAKQEQVEAPSKDYDAIQSLVGEKNKLKNQWLKKFTLILNAKKEHICALENQLEKLKHGGGGSKTSTTSKRRNVDAESTEEE